ncbi:MAG TPA: hypothetical protein VF618_26910 [Thermoanaerobaculia bacterium]
MTFLFVLLLTVATPEECISRGNVAVEHAGKTYRLASEECRQQFLEDPERYAQLYDALLELEALGVKPKPRQASLVPS